VTLKEAKSENSDFIAYDFDKQFMKYLQVLDTDFEEYMVIYSCQENAEFEDEKGSKVPEEKAWGFRKNVKKNDEDDDRGSTVEYNDDIKVNPVHSETISIHWRQPKTADGSYTFDPTKIAPAKLAVAMAKAETLVPSIDKANLKLQHMKQGNGEPCNYDPFGMTLSAAEKEKKDKAVHEENA